MLRASWLILLIAAGSGCVSTIRSVEAGTEAAPSRPAKPQAISRGADADAGATATLRPLIKIQAFDCEKLEKFPGLARPTGPVTASNGIRAWDGGGPNGANWNVGDLRCVVGVATDCRHGKVELVVRVGRSIAGKRQVDLSGPSTAQIEVEIPGATWRRNLDERERGTVVERPYRKAVFRANVAVTCRAPLETGPNDASYLEVNDDSAFASPEPLTLRICTSLQVGRPSHIAMAAAGRAPALISMGRTPADSPRQANSEPTSVSAARRA